MARHGKMDYNKDELVLKNGIVPSIELESEDCVRQ